MNRRRVLGLTVLLAEALLAATACRGGGTATPPPTAVAQGTILGEVTGAAEAGAAAPTPVRATPPGAGPGAEAAPSGPFLLFATSQGGLVVDTLWAVSQDLSDVRALASDVQIAAPTDWDLSKAISPTGEYLAFLTTTDPNGYRGLALNMMRLPGGGPKVVTPLTTERTEPVAPLIIDDPNFEVVRAMSEVSSLAWPPDGQRLAFIGAMDGPSADLYVYTLADRSVTRLSDLDVQAIHPTWSPDGRWIVYVGVGSLGTGAGYDVRGVWAAAADGSELKLLYEPQSGDEVWVAWTGPDTLMLYSWEASCGPNSLRELTVGAGEVQVVWAANFSDVAADPATGTALITVDQYTAGCGIGGDMGTFFVDAAGNWTQVDPGDSYRPVWSEAAGAFFALAGDGAVQVSTAGEAIQLTSPIRTVPVVSPDRAYWAWASHLPDESGLYVGPYGETAGMVTLDPVIFPTWSPDSRRLLFFSDQALFAAATPDFSITPVIEGLQPVSWPPIWVTP